MTLPLLYKSKSSLNFLKKSLKDLLIFIVLLAAGIFLFVSLAPQFGRAPEGQRLARIEASPHYRDGAFMNTIHTSMDMSADSILSVLKEFMTAKNTRSDEPLPVNFSEKKSNPDSLIHVTWFGHSAVLLETEGKRILLDPMFGPAASPLPFFAKRFAYRETIDFAQFKKIDAVVVSHDHYEHLDYGSIQKLIPNVRRFYRHTHDWHPLSGGYSATDD